MLLEQVLLWIGRLEAEKNPLEFVVIAGAHLMDEGFDGHAFMIGDSPHDARYGELVRASVAGRFESRFSFHRAIDPLRIPLYYSLAAVSGGCLVSTSNAEALPMTFLEAAACQCPVVSSRVGGVKEFVKHERTGWLYELGDEEAALNAVKSVLAGERVDTVIEAAQRKVATTHSAERSTALFIRTLRECRIERILAQGKVQTEVQSGQNMSLRKGTPRVFAIVASFNEEDIIGATIAHLVASGVDVYLIDNWSTDQTVKVAEEWLGRGLVAVERFPLELPTRPREWRSVLRRKLEVAAEHAADWYIHHDADEIREPPWPGLNLDQGIALVDRLGFNCIDFHVLNFRPIDGGYRKGFDPAEYFTHYELGDQWDALQLKCWKAQAGPVDLVATGGHEARFDSRRTFPVKFILRHYPIRGPEHGRRKVLIERRHRFAEDERAMGWHVQYDAFEETSSFLWSEGGLTYDPERVRFELMLRNRDEVDELSRVGVISERLGQLKSEVRQEIHDLVELADGLAEEDVLP